MAATGERPAAEVVIVGGGLAGALLALALAERQLPVRLIDPATPPFTPATALTYGGVPWWAGPDGPLDRLMATAPSCWQALQRRHGALGWHPCRLRLHWPASEAGSEAVVAARQAVERLARRHLPPEAIEQGPRELRLAYARLDPPTLARALPAACERAGIRCDRRRVVDLQPEPSGGWRLRLDQGSLTAATLVLAAGAGCRALWPALPARLRHSWAGVLLVEDPADRRALVGEAADVWMPLLGARQPLEARAAALTSEACIVDPGLAPWGEGLLLGQTTLVRPTAALGEPPDPAPLEARLRAALLPLLPALDSVRARFLQTPVSFVPAGAPLVGPVAGAAGLWVCAGFGGPFALVPPLAEEMAAAIAGDGAALARLPGAAS
jgi:glycine/D-amino acid oxidase-like deaminating enzyme